MKGRFAPSPTGRMHLGNVFSALLSWLSARSKGGEWLLRIEDLDPQRSRREYADMIMEDLRWLGLEWDEGPGRERVSAEPYWQSERSDIYEKYLRKLCAKGLVYPCHCTRADILATQAPHESDGRVVYKGTCRPKAGYMADLSEVAALRLMVPDEEVRFTDGHYGEGMVNLAQQCGDFIVRRKDGAWAYQLAVVVDDALMGVTEVVRGRDLLLSAPQQMYVARLLGFDSPAFTHLPLLCNAAGQRLSKRDKSLDMGALRERFTPEEVIGRLAFLAGLTDREEPMAAKELVDYFSWERVPCDDIMV